MHIEKLPDGSVNLNYHPQRDIPPARHAIYWCGPGTLYWLSVDSGLRVPQTEIAERIKFEPLVGTSGSQFIEGVAVIGLHCSPWVQTNLETISELLKTRKCWVVVNWTHGSQPDDNHYSTIGAVDEYSVVHNDTQVDGSILIYPRNPWIEKWYHHPEDDVTKPITDLERNWALIVTKTLADLYFINWLAKTKNLKLDTTNSFEKV